ncbi:MAG: class I SAM-dependent methyltransferase [bacterium]|nr:class I SAM-dependent methyltransferase [bacterium]
MHDILKDMKGYICSEYYGNDIASETYVNGILHENLINLSFPDNYFDLVISADVLEHVNDPYKAHREIYRVLKVGGRHIFSAPFIQTDFLDVEYATIGENGNLIHLKEPSYHIDPLRPEGALVFRLFSLEMLIELRKIGFWVNLYHLYSPLHGIIGPNAIIFEAIK